LTVLTLSSFKQSTRREAAFNASPDLQRSIIMGTNKMPRTGLAIASAVMAAAAISVTTANAGSIPAAGAAKAVYSTNMVDNVRHRGGGGIGIYIGPSYGYGYGYYPRSYYAPRYSYYDDGYYYRPYRRHHHRWARERFEHPLGRR
jgi:hypothetical protein